MRKTVIVSAILCLIPLFLACRQEAPVKTIRLNISELLLQENHDTLLVAEVVPGNASALVEWRSMDETIASVDSEGRVKGLFGGRTFILASAGGVTKGCAVSVFARVESIAFEESSLRVLIGRGGKIHVSFTPERALNHKLVWSSSDETVATVSGGVVAGKALGEAVITAVSEDNPSAKASCRVEVVLPTEDDLPSSEKGDIETLVTGDSFTNWIYN